MTKPWVVVVWLQYLHKALKKLNGDKDLASNHQLLPGRSASFPCMQPDIFFREIFILTVHDILLHNFHFFLANQTMGLLHVSSAR
jgi:hypothetical protein